MITAIRLGLAALALLCALPAYALDPGAASGRYLRDKVHIDLTHATALMQDYAVIAAPDRTGGGAWTREYDYAQAYHQAEYSPAALIPLISTLEDDRRGRSEASEQYMNDYFVGKKIPELKPFWPQYACSLANYTARGYSGCVCSQGK